MEYSFKHLENRLHIYLSGDLIGDDAAQQLLLDLETQVTQQVQYAFINLSGLRYINSSGLKVLITLLTRFRQRQGDVLLIAPSEEVNKLLLITKLNSIFTVVNAEEEALQLIPNL